MSLLSHVRQEIKKLDLQKDRPVALKIQNDALHLATSIALLEAEYSQTTIPSFMGSQQRETLESRIGNYSTICDINFSKNTLKIAALTLQIPGLESRANNKFFEIKNNKSSIFLQTSGTTSEPKLIKLSIEDLLYQAERHPEYFDSKYLRLNSCQHKNTLRHRLYVYFMGGTNIFMQKPNIDSLSAYCEEHSPDIIDITSYHFSQIYQAKTSIPSQTKIVVAGSSIDMTLLQKAAEMYSLFIRYGTTETGTLAICGPIQADTKKLQYEINKNASVRIGSDSTVDNKEGLIYIHAKGVGRSADEIFLKRKHEKAHWHNTGDLGLIDQNGELQIIGRACEMIIFNSRNINPLEIESVLQRHPKVIRCAAFPIESKIHGQIPAAAVETIEPDSVSEIELLELCREKLGFSRPRKIHITNESIIDANSGKTNRTELSKLFSAK